MGKDTQPDRAFGPVRERLYISRIKERRASVVYVLSKHGQPLMPCKPRKACVLLKAEKAKVIRRTPFTIQLIYGSSGYKQPVTLGVDAGSKTIGLSASTEQKELFAAELKPRNDVVNLLSTRREYRKARRSRTTRYRQPRFNNRVHSKHKGWLAPSVEVKIHNHIQGIKLVMSILPITFIILETAEFDMQRLKAMEEGKSLPIGTDYQLGEMYDYYNVRQYVLHRDGYKCRYCGAHKDVKFHVHHLESRKTGGNRPANLITMCAGCHKKYHDGLISLDKVKKGSNYRDAAFMGIMRKTLVQRVKALYPNVEIRETMGYITKYTRETNNLVKSHTTDALCIAKHSTAARTDKTYTIKPVRQHNRCLHKATILKGGIRKRNQAPREVKGFQLFDKVLYKGIECFIWGRRLTGSFLLRLIDGTNVKDGVGYKQLKLLERSSNCLIQ